jgi:pyrimidine-nucleoside phosphorylase
MRFVEIIAKKRDGQALSRADIDAFVEGVGSGELPDYQASALLMAIVLRGLSDEETVWLTDAMVRSGDRLDLSDIEGPKVGKHSTGGVGDKVSLVVAPLVATCGVKVPKMSGRGLGHTGGTLDKLESIPGFRGNLSVEEFKKVLREVGTSIVGQSATLAPADRKLYALRDVTATVESIPLISASVMGKKLAEGTSALVLDVKCGDGAFMKDLHRARMLARSMVSIGGQSGVRTEAVITAMDAPLGRAVGNALEVREAIETLKGGGPADLRQVTLAIASRMLLLGGVESELEAARDRVDVVLASGRAVETLARMIERQGGNPRVIDDDALLPAARCRHRLLAGRSGYVTSTLAEALGRASSVMGAGRARVGDPVDPAVGLVMLVKPGDAVGEGTPVVELHHRDGLGLEAALDLCRQAVVIGDEAPAPRPMILGEVK